MLYEFRPSPLEEGAPSHLFMHTFPDFDPWNDSPREPEQSWGLFDMRRISQPPRPSYVMLPLPRLFDLCWLQEALALEFPKLPYVGSAYMGPDLIVEHCSPQGNTPLLTLYPHMHFVFEPSAFVDTVLDTHALLGLRPGFKRCFHPDRTREIQVPGPHGHDAEPSSSAAASVACTFGFPGHLPALLTPVEDDEAASQAPEALLVFSPGQAPRLVDVSRLLTPGALLVEAARSVQLAGTCTLHVPTLSPLISGHVPCIALLPHHRNRPHHVLLVDCRCQTRLSSWHRPFLVAGMSSGA